RLKGSSPTTEILSVGPASRPKESQLYLMNHLPNKVIGYQIKGHRARRRPITMLKKTGASVEKRVWPLQCTLLGRPAGGVLREIESSPTTTQSACFTNWRLCEIIYNDQVLPPSR
ncbi:hypothetical protein L9F63_022087, partial [Diploptera punctata]